MAVVGGKQLPRSFGTDSATLSGELSLVGTLGVPMNASPGEEEGEEEAGMLVLVNGLVVRRAKEGNQVSRAWFAYCLCLHTGAKNGVRL